ncbi:MAG: MAPEG family protein [Hyphomonadaceae bacterium]|nr:MAPEG family protein [Hyphomonadaceae bacterium]
MQAAPDPAGVNEVVVTAIEGLTIQEFLLPAVLLAAWTMVMWLWMYATRIPAMRKAGINPNDARHPGTALAEKMPPNVRSIADNYNHLHEAPTVFYAVMAFAAISGGDDYIAWYIAWGYLGLRVLHSLVQVLSPVVAMRFSVFALSSFALMALVGKEVLRAFT